MWSWGKIRTISSPESVSADSSNRSEEHTSELQSRLHLVCRLLLEKKKNNAICPRRPTLPNRAAPPPRKSILPPRQSWCRPPHTSSCLCSPCLITSSHVLLYAAPKL